MEQRLTLSAQGDLRALWDMSPARAAVLPDSARHGAEWALDEVQFTPTADISVGSVVLVCGGELVPLDGEVIYTRAQPLTARLRALTRVHLSTALFSAGC